ncbi:MAG: hypothetical protein ACK4UN_11360, partial [Limisphaerales bacterium]
MNPATGEIGQPVPIGNNPNRLAISSNGRFLYVGLDDENKVKQFDLLTETTGVEFALGSGQRAESLLVSPTNDSHVVVYRLPEGKIAFYDNGAKRPQELTGKRPVDIGGLNLIAFSALSAELYVCAGYYSDVPLYRVAVSQSGLSLADSQPGHQSQTTELKSDGGLLFYNRGMVVDPQTKRVKAIMPVTGSPFVEPDVDSGRVFYLTQSGGWKLRSFDLHQGIELASIDIPGFSGTPKKLVRWGATGFAICTSSGQVIVLQGMLLPVAPLADLAISQTVSTFTAITNDFVSVTLTATNNGPFDLGDLVITQAFSLTVTNLNASTTEGTISTASNVVTWGPGALRVGEAVSMTSTFRSQQAGTLNISAAAFHPGADPFWGNNVGFNAITISDGTPSSELQVRMNTRELLYDPARNRIYASIPASNGFFGNLVIALNPQTGALESAYAAGSEPSQLALADDRLYVSLNGEMGARRVNLETGTADLEFPFGTNDMYYAHDILLQPRSPERLAVSLGSLNRASPHPADVLLYENGFPLQRKGGPATGLTFAEDGTCLFGQVYGSGINFVRMWP